MLVLVGVAFLGLGGGLLQWVAVP